MSNQIQFPKNYDRFISLGKESMKKENVIEAIDYFQEAYAIRQEFSLNYLLVGSYLKSGEKTQALSMIEEMRTEYLSCLEYIETYIQTLILNHRFLTAHGVINDRILKENSGEMRVLVALKKKVRQAELLYQQFEVKKIEKIKNELSKLGSCSYYEQMYLVKKAMSLPQEEFIEVSREILTNKDIHNLVRSWALEELCRIHYRKEVQFLWRDNQVYDIVPASAGAPLDSMAYQRIVLFLEKELLNNHHVLLLDLQEEIRLHFALLYPFADKIIKDPKLWAICCIKSYNDQAAVCYKDELATEEAARIQEIQRTIRFELENFVI
ncbi:hypothetical protein LI951_07950 [Enterococcus sp. BWT-B8]|uniref:hypothetical protein n=1 Tax=Enterococcus sp. BWT-B8 TaxID=2885157 RepID=UPI001E4FB2F5|nr:hypothetical protein [Enterococcus sp. BWT-B8]MCB5951994.1 hypothetical protein [Enterococcus sp. BWT-B8]